MIKSLFCSHDYEIIFTHHFKSHAQLMLEHGISGSVKGDDHGSVLIIKKCTKCEKVAETVRR